MERLLVFLPPSTLPPSHSKQAAQKIKRECFSSSRPAHSISNGYKKSSRAMVWVAIGSNSSDNSKAKMKLDRTRVLESKRDFRRRLATLPIAEKLRMLDALRVRTLAIRRASISGATKRH